MILSAAVFQRLQQQDLQSVQSLHANQPHRQSHDVVSKGERNLEVLAPVLACIDTRLGEKRAETG